MRRLFSLSFSIGAIGLFLLLAANAHARSFAVYFYVAPDGKDAWSGRRDTPNRARTDGPLATLQRACDLAQTLDKAAKRPTEIRIYLRGGDYALSQPVVTTLNSDSNGVHTPVVIANYRSETARLHGGRELRGWKRVTDAAVLERLDAGSRGQVFQADLKAQGISNAGAITRDGWNADGSKPGPSELFFNDKPMTIARWPNVGYATIADVPKEGGNATFAYAGDRPTRWKNAPDGWLHGYWQFDWADSYTPIQAIHDDTRTLQTGGVSDDYGIRKGQRFYALNLLEELDAPGEYYIDHAKGLVYFWPPAPLETGETRLSLLDAPLLTLKGAHYVTIEGLILEDTRGEGIRIEGGADNLVAGCTLRNMGLMGVRITGGQRNGVQSCDLYNMGQGAIALDGGDRKTLERGDNFARNNSVHDYSNWVRCYRPAIGVNGVGQSVANNLLYNGPHTAILLGGNEHRIEFNEIRHVCTDTGDVGAFYMGRDWTMRGNRITGNYFHHLGGFKGEGFSDAMAVYLDDAASGSTVQGNICYKAGRAVMVGGGRDNKIIGNRFLDCSPSVHVDARGVGWAKDHIKRGGDWQMYEKLEAVHFDQPPYRDRYPALVTLLNEQPAMPNGTRVEENVALGGAWTELQDGLTEQTAGFAKNTVKPANPYGGLEDRQVLARVLKDYPVPGLAAPGIGLQTDRYRKTHLASDSGSSPKAKKTQP